MTEYNWEPIGVETSANDWEFWYSDAYEITTEVVRLYARATRNSFVPYDSARVIPVDTPVPSTLLGSPVGNAAAELVSKHIPGCNLSRLVHVEQKFAYVDRLQIGMHISLGTRLVSRREKAGVEVLSLEAVAAEGSKVCVTAVMTLAYSHREFIDLSQVDRLADEVMLTGTGPSASDAYSAALQGQQRQPASASS